MLKNKKENNVERFVICTCAYFVKKSNFILFYFFAKWFNTCLSDSLIL